MANTKIQIILCTGGLILLGVIAWSIGWAAHSLLDRPDPLPTERTEATPSIPTHGPTHGPTLSPTSPPAATLTQPPAATVAPATSTPAPTEERRVEMMIVMASDRGAYDVVRRACGLPRNYVLRSDDEIVQETWQSNGFVEENPEISNGQEIQVPIYLCP